MVAVARNRESSGFGEALRKLREAAGWTQTELGDRAGMKYQAVARYERGVTEPTWPVVLRLASALGVSTELFRSAPPAAQRPMGKRK